MRAKVEGKTRITRKGLKNEGSSIGTIN